MSRGSKEVAETHLGHALDALRTIGDNLVSSRLTTTENIEWKSLRDLAHDRIKDDEKIRLKFLNDKALGIEKDTVRVDSLFGFTPK